MEKSCRTNEVRDVILAVITASSERPSFYEQAELSADYPYSVFDMRRMTATEGIERYALEVNVWDKYKTYSRVDYIADAIERDMDKTVLMINSAVLTMHKDSRQIIEDEDKNIRRIRLQMELIIVAKE